jgi:hypothetical protein
LAPSIVKKNPPVNKTLARIPGSFPPFLDGLLERFDDKRVKALAFVEGLDSQDPVQIRASPQHKLAGVIFVRRRRQGPSLFLIYLDPVVDDLTEFSVDVGLANLFVAPLKETSRRAELSQDFF